MWVRFLKSKDDTCSEFECIMVEIRRLHARRHSSCGTVTLIVIKFDPDIVFEASMTRHMCARMGVGVQFWAPYAHHMLVKAERPWRTLTDNASAMLHNMSVLYFTWSCADSIIAYLRNRTYIPIVGLSSGVPLTMLTSTPPDASKFRIFGCTVFAKVPDKLHRNLGEKAFRMTP
jgi:hypothetical protein